MPCSDPPTGRPGPPARRSTLLVAERRSHGIRLSLASSLLAMWADGLTGNRLAAEAAADPANGLAAIAVVGPRRTAHVGRLVDEAERSGAVGYRLDGWDGTTPPPESVREVLRAVAATGRPLLVPIVRFGAASVIGAATEGLGIPVVLLGAHYMHIVDDVAAAVRYPHLHLETSALAHYRAIETVVGSIGAERVLFGTGSPASGGRIADQRGPRRVDPGRGQARDPRRQRRPPVRRGGWAGRSHDGRRSRAERSTSTRTSGRSISTCRRWRTPTWSADCVSRGRRRRSPRRRSRSSVTRRVATPRWPAPPRPATVTACTATSSPIRPTWTRPRTSCGATWTHRACSGSRSTASGAARRRPLLR